MIRNILSIIIGLLICFFLILFGESFIHSHLITLPETVDINKPETIRTFIATAPASFHLLLLLNYAIATFVGSFFAAIIASTRKISKAITIGGILTGVGVFNLFTAGHPVWVIILGLFAFLPFAFSGGYMGSKLTSSKK